MIPAFTDNGHLPPGEHPATLEEVQQRFATTPTRLAQYEGLVRACTALALAGCKTIWLNGSYITNKKDPGDYDAAFRTEEIDWTVLGLSEPELMDFDHPRTVQKSIYGGELLPTAIDGFDFIEFFQTTNDDQPKGIIRIDIEELA